MRVVVTGGAGFIGSHLCEYLICEGHEVSAIDDMNDFYSPQEKQDNVDAIKRRGALNFFRADITDAESIATIFTSVRPDAVVHLAARAGVRASIEYPLLYANTNILGTLVLLEECRKNKVKKVVFASSSSVYGLSNCVPFKEQDRVNTPISPYAATKLAGEHLVFTYTSIHNISAICLRFFTVYGPRQRPDLAIRKFTEMIEAGEPIPFFGDGSSGRDYTFVDDTVSGIAAAIHYDCDFDIFNIGNSSPITLYSLVEALERALGKTARIRSLPWQPGDMPITYADITKAQQLLGYRPRTTLQQGLDRFVAWWRSAALQTQPVRDVRT